MNLINDKSCGWINDLPKRINVKSINKDENCDFLIVGAGYTGLSAARQLSKINSNYKIIIIDAQLAGEGASGRNSGYLVDTTLNDSYSFKRDIDAYQKKINIYDLGINTVKKFIKDYQVDCDWNEAGKYFSSSLSKDLKKLEKFKKLLDKLNFENEILNEIQLERKLGTKFYKTGIYTKGGVLLHPAKLVRAMIDVLPKSVELFENSYLNSWKQINNKIESNVNSYKIISNKIIFCSNAFLSSMGVKKKFNFPLTLTASLTRKLTEKEYEEIGKPKEWGVLPVRPMGATVRFTKDRRILIRNTSEYRNPNFMDQKTLDKRILIHKIGLKKRFPSLPNDIISSSWSGVVSRSSNGSQIFERLNERVFVAGSYFGSGIGAGTLFGEQIALMATNQDTDEIRIIEERKKPNRLPIKPILSLGVYLRLFYERLIAKTEI